MLKSKLAAGAVVFLGILLMPVTVFAGNGFIEELQPVVDIMRQVLTFLLSIAGGYFILMLIINSFKLASSTGRPDKRSDAITSLMFNILGAIVCFGAAYLVHLAQVLVEDLPGVDDPTEIGAEAVIVVGQLINLL